MSMNASALALASSVQVHPHIDQWLRSSRLAVPFRTLSSTSQEWHFVVEVAVLMSLSNHKHEFVSTTNARYLPPEKAKSAPARKPGRTGKLIVSWFLVHTLRFSHQSTAMAYDVGMEHHVVIRQGSAPLLGNACPTCGSTTVGAWKPLFDDGRAVAFDARSGVSCSNGHELVRVHDGVVEEPNKLAEIMTEIRTSHRSTD